MNEQITIKELFSLDKTIATGIFEGAVYPWEVLSKIGDYIVELGNSLPQKEYYKRGDNIWIHKEATVFDSAYIAGPAIICKGAEVRHCAFIRGKAVVGENAVVGNSTELKNVILFDNVQVPHYNYVGDSILGYKAHMGACLWIHKDGTVNTYVVRVFLNEFLPPCSFYVVLQLYTKISVIPCICKTSVNLRTRIYKSS